MDLRRHREPAVAIGEGGIGRDRCPLSASRRSGRERGQGIPKESNLRQPQTKIMFKILCNDYPLFMKIFIILVLTIIIIDTKIYKAFTHSSDKRTRFYHLEDKG